MTLETTEVRKMDSTLKYDLANFLDCDDRWKSLMAKVTVDCVPTNSPKYNVDHIKLIEMASKSGRSCTEIFFEEWGTSGRIRPNLKVLRDLLFELKLTRIAEELASKITGDQPINKLETSINDIDECIDNNDNEDFKSSLVDHEQETTSALNDDQNNLSVGDIKKVLYECLSKATNRFSDSCLIGSGGFSNVFKANLNNQKVAIKRMKFEDKNVIKQYLNEIEIVLKFKHDNILPLLAISYDDEHPCIVYELMENGSLLDALKNRSALDWPRRIQIGIDVASGLAYLHTAFETPFVHRDIKTANILLDSNFIAKIGDFGLTRIGNHTQTSLVTSVVIGTSAYMSPEAYRGEISVLLDVFSYGIVLLELLTGLAPYDKYRNSGADLLSHVIDIMDSKNTPIEELIDKHPGYLNNSIAKQIYDLARRCAHSKKIKRPAMDGKGGVFESLKNIKSEICV